MRARRRYILDSVLSRLHYHNITIKGFVDPLSWWLHVCLIVDYILIGPIHFKQIQVPCKITYIISCWYYYFYCLHCLSLFKVASYLIIESQNDKYIVCSLSPHVNCNSTEGNLSGEYLGITPIINWYVSYQFMFVCSSYLCSTGRR